ncbi:MAG: c-type cytochrome [Candidatus Acidiferrales bacterium]
MRTILQVIGGVVMLALLAGAVYVGFFFPGRGFSASDDPSQLEELISRRVRALATPAGTKEKKNPHPVREEALAAARAHWVDHCATCHALDGSGQTSIGQNLYPKAPDMRAAATQALTDGELYSIIENGIRFTGMPAWGTEHSAEDDWQLVMLIRRLPKLSPEELKEMEKLAAAKGGGHTHAPGTPPHKD